MPRFFLLMCLLCSLTLNVYFFMQLNINSIEHMFQRERQVVNQGNADHFVDSDLKRAGNNAFPMMSSHHDKAQAIVDDSAQHRSLQVSHHGSQDSTAIKAQVNSAEGDKQRVIEQIKQAIDERDFFVASFLINTLANEHVAESALNKIKVYWLQITQALINEGSYIHAENAISAYLSYQGDDVDFLRQQIDLYWQQQLAIPAIRYAYEMQYHVFTEVQKDKVITFARDLVKQQIEKLVNNGLWLELKELLAQVIIFDPDNLNLPWYFARAEYQLGEFESARNAIEPFLSLANYRVEAKALSEKIDAALRMPESIALTRQGEHFIVDALVNDSFQVSLMIDTGASISLLSESAYEDLNRYVDTVYIRDLRLNTAGGQITASVYQVVEFSIQGYTVKDFTFVVSPHMSARNDGLLGMNFLSAFDFHIDQQNSRLTLKNKN